MTEADAQAIAGWRYDEPYSLYDPGPGSVAAMLEPANDYHAALDRDGTLVGYCCFGADARVPGLEEEPGVLDVGGGLRPDLTGVGLGGPFLRACCALGAELHDAREFRVVVAAFNRRAQLVAAALGFERSGLHATPEREYVLLTRPA